MSSKLRFMPHEEGAGTKAQRLLHRTLLKTGIPCKWEHKVCGLNIDILVGPHDEVCVEVWGESHLIESVKRKDAWRKRTLIQHGYRFISFWDDEVEKNVAWCVAQIVYMILEESASRG